MGEKPRSRSRSRFHLPSCFHWHTSRSHERQDDRKDSIQSEPKTAQDEKESMSKSPDSGPDSTQDTTTEAGNGSKATQRSAYDQAYSELTSDQLERIGTSRFQKPQELFASLNQKSSENYRKTRFQNGFKKCEPYLDGLRQFAEFANLFSGFDPTGSAGVVFALTSSAISASLELCGTAHQLESHIIYFVQLVPSLYRCDEFLQASSSIEVINEALVRIYSSMFEFYFAVLDILEPSGFVYALLKHHDHVAECVNAFSTNWKQLLEQLNVETYGGVARTELYVRDQQIETLLGAHREKELAFRPDGRAEGSCQWLSSTSEFKSWHQSTSSRTQFVTMFGNVGCGKTTTVAYVCELLDSEEAIVCRYYCKDDGERNKVQNAYSSLIGQLLVYDPTLDEYYLKWNKDTKALDSQKQVQRPEHLRVCLVDLVRHAKRPVCIVIDALDECEETSWEELMILFDSLSNLETHCKVFLSSRHHDDIKKAIPGKTFEMTLSRNEARLIAKHILDDYFQKEHWNHISEEDRQLLLEKVCGKAERSAIWIHLVLAHVNLICKDEIPQPDLERFLEVVENAPSDQAGLQDLYGKLYQQTCRAKKVEARKVEPILEFLAFADRPVKLREVTSFAVFLDQGQKRLPKALTQEDNRRTLDLIRYFVSRDGNSRPDSLVRPVHQSLKDLTLQKRPSAWMPEKDAPKIIETPAQHQARVHRMLADSCLGWLQLPECSKERLVPSGESQAASFTRCFDLFDDAPPEPADKSNGAKPALKDFDPAARGFGDSFGYSACSWAYHLGKCTEITNQDVKSVVSICRARSTLLQNWTDQYRFPSCSFSREDGYLPSQESLDALYVAVFFKLPVLVSMILKNYDVWKSPHFHQSANYSSADNAISCALLTEQFDVAETIFTLCGNKMHTLDYWSWFMSKYNPWNTDSDNEGWSSFFGTVIKGMLPKFVKWGPEALCVAASHGCHIAVKELLDRSNEDARLRHALFEDRGRDGKHQSIGVAARQGHLDILTLLCEQQPAVAAHLRHRGPDGETAFHAAAAMVASRFEPAVVAALVDAWPEGADLPGDHTTPLHTLAMCDTGEDGYVEAARTLLATGRVDANFVTEEGSGALIEAVSRGREAMVEVLVKEGGAKLDRVLWFDGEGCPRYVDEYRQPMDKGKRKAVLEQLVRLNKEVPEGQRVGGEYVGKEYRFNAGGGLAGGAGGAVVVEEVRA